jgi:hypothetical protein
MGEEDKQTGYITLIRHLMEYLHEEKKFRDNPEADNYLVNEYQNHWEYPTL